MLKSLVHLIILLCSEYIHQDGKLIKTDPISDTCDIILDCYDVKIQWMTSYASMVYQATEPAILAECYEKSTR